MPEEELKYQEVLQSCSSQIDSIHQIDSIFIFSKDNHRHTLLSAQNSKVIGIYNDIDLLISSILKQMQLIYKNIYNWCFFNQNEYGNKDLSKQANDFLYLRLFHHLLLYVLSELQIKRQKIHSSCHHASHNVQESEREYESTEAIQSFMKNLSLQQTINTALRSEDTNRLYTLRCVLSDLLQNLSQTH